MFTAGLSPKGDPTGWEHRVLSARDCPVRIGRAVGTDCCSHSPRLPTKKHCFQVLSDLPVQSKFGLTDTQFSVKWEQRMFPNPVGR